MSFLKIKNLSVDYQMRKETVYAAKNVNIEVNKREILGLVGESGSGKSTVGNAIINLISIAPDDTFPENTLLTYNFTLMSSEGIESDLNSLIPDLVYKNIQQPNFVIKR